eukprot:425055_1
MATESLKLREIANLLTDSLSKEIISDIKSKILSIADDLEQKASSHLTGQSIDNILDEIDENENRNDNSSKKMDKKEYDLLCKSLVLTLCHCTGHPVIQKLFARQFGNGLSDTLSRKTWPLLFRTVPKANLDQYLAKTKRRIAHVYEPAPLSKLCGDLTNEQLLKVFDAIPKELKDDTEAQCIDIEQYDGLVKWIIAYRDAPNNANKALYDRIYDALIRHAYWAHMSELVSGQNTTSNAVQFYDKYHEYIDINHRSCSTGETLLHSCANNSDSNAEHMIKWLMSLGGIDHSTKDYEGNTPMEIARNASNWVVVNALTFASMSNKMRQKSDEQIAKLTRNTGIIKQWFRFYSVNDVDSAEYRSMVKMVESLKTLIKNRLPISDDMLLLCMNFEMQNGNGNPLECSLWHCLYNTLNEILRIPLNRRNWLWFKQYIFNSSLWFQQIPNEKRLLYHLLMEMVSKQLKAQRDYLRPYVDKLEKKSDDETKEEDDDDDGQIWEKLKTLPQLIATDNPEGLRQDECIDKETGKELLPFPIRPQFNTDQLRRLNDKVKEFDCHNHYNVNGYLSKLVLTAHSLNGTFHEAMKLLFGIDKMTSENIRDGVKYLQGPVKRLVRSQAKAETDYSHCAYPTTAKIVDFIRCCLVYANPKDLLKGIDKFVKSVKGEEKIPICTKLTRPYRKTCGKCMESRVLNSMPSAKVNKTCFGCDSAANDDDTVYACDAHRRQTQILCMNCAEKQIKKRNSLKKILRIKNMFLDNKRENGNEWDLYRYADIKMGVLMEYNGQSMIVEVQFLLDWMLKAKSLGHGLYEIERNAEFIFDVNKIRHLAAKDDDNIDKSLREAIIKGNENALATLILNEAPVDLMKIDKTKNGLIHCAVESKHKKMVKFLLDTVQSDESQEQFSKFINMIGESGETAIQKAQGKQTADVLRVLLSYKEIDVNAKDEYGESLLFKAVKDGDISGKAKQVFEVVTQDERCDLNAFDEWGYNLLHAACENCANIKFSKKVWNSGHFKINGAESGKRTPLILACSNPGRDSKGHTQLVEFLLSIPDIDANCVDDQGMTGLDYAIKNKYLQIIDLLYKHKDVDWKIGANKFVTACESSDIEMCKLVFKLWPDVDVNGMTSYGYSAVHVCIDKSAEMMEYVLNVPGINPDICNEDGDTPWLLAMHNFGYQYIDRIGLLFARKDIDFNRTKGGKNALDIVQRYDKKMINWLKSNGFTSARNRKKKKNGRSQE